MRVSLASRGPSTSLCAGSSCGSKNHCQQPGPNGVAIVVSLMHSPSGMLPGFWSDFGGNTYVSLLIGLLVIPRAGVAVFSDWVFVSAQRPSLRAVPVGLPVSEPSPATVLRKYSVPFRSVEYCPTGEVAGHTV